MEKFKLSYNVNSTNHSDNITKSFLETYLSNISTINRKTKKINTIIPEIANTVEIPSNSLMNIPDTLLFYIRKVTQFNKPYPLGLVAINEHIVNEVSEEAI